MITLTDVANAAGVSRSAVSKALLGGGGKTTKVSAKTVQRIQQTAERLGYRTNLLAQRLASKRQNVIGLIIDSQSCHLYSKIMTEIEHLICQVGYRLQVGVVHDNFEVIKKYVDDFLGYNIQSIICMAHYYDFSEKIPPLFKPFRNALFINKPMTDDRFSFVSPDYYTTFFDAVTYLLRLNRRKIIFVKTVYKTYDAEVRAQAFRDAHRACGVEFDERQIYCEPVYELDTQELMNRFLHDVLPMHPDAFILGCADATMWCMHELHARHIRIPEDISIIGMDEWNGSQAMIPSITVMDNNAVQVAQEAVRIILSNIDNPNPQVQEVFVKGSLIRGGSCSMRQPS